jgi:hypothetical protein
MRLEKLTIALKNEYQKAGPDNPYQAKLDVSYNDNRMTVALPDDTVKALLRLLAPEVARAAQVQIQDFVDTALAVSAQVAIEGRADEPATD